MTRAAKSVLDGPSAPKGQRSEADERGRVGLDGGRDVPETLGPERAERDQGDLLIVRLVKRSARLLPLRIGLGCIAAAFGFGGCPVRTGFPQVPARCPR